MGLLLVKSQGFWLMVVVDSGVMYEEWEWAAAKPPSCGAAEAEEKER
jgi:hypothetical protein